MDGFLQILLFGGLIFVMMRFGCGSHMFGGHGKAGHGKAGHGKSGHGKAGGCCGGGGKKHSDASFEKERNPSAPPKEAVDPVCGKTVITNGARTSFHEGLVYYFCSSECRDGFEATPSRFINMGKETAPPRLEQHPVESGGH